MALAIAQCRHGLDAGTCSLCSERRQETAFTVEAIVRREVAQHPQMQPAALGHHVLSIILRRADREALLLPVVRGVVLQVEGVERRANGALVRLLNERRGPFGPLDLVDKNRVRDIARASATGRGKAIAWAAEVAMKYGGTPVRLGDGKRHVARDVRMAEWRTRLATLQRQAQGLANEIEVCQTVMRALEVAKVDRLRDIPAGRAVMA